jgi:putative ABC transport system substrate-binding protein
MLLGFVREKVMNQVRRRQFLIAAGARLAAPLAVGLLAPHFPSIAQPQSRIPRIGFLSPGARNFETYQAFLRGMRELGYIEGKNVLIEARFADGKLERLPLLAEELVKSRIDLLVAGSTPGVRAARRATETVPIVMVAVGDPVGSGFVASLPRPGGNVTGHAILTQDTSTKLLEILKDAMPKLSRITALINSGNPNHAIAVKNIQEAGGKLNVRVAVAAVQAAHEIEAIFAAAAREQQDAVVVPADPLFTVQRREIADFALRHKLPTAFSQSTNVDAGGLLSYGASIADSFRRGAYFVDRIIKGAKPRELPVEQVTTLEFVINLKTAKALGLKIPPAVLARAERVID